MKAPAVKYTKVLTPKAIRILASVPLEGPWTRGEYLEWFANAVQSHERLRHEMQEMGYARWGGGR